MSRVGKRAFWRNESGATAALYALALPALVAIGGVGFDYARLAGMDSELQNAADQAALAAATQLDGNAESSSGAGDGARARATAAACSLVSNQTLLSNDGNGLAVAASDGSGGCTGISEVLFWQDKDKTTEADSDANAHFAEVILDVRVADYAFTPITGVLFGNADAAAMAGLGSSICKVPPVMICNPAESTDSDFTVANYIGKGLRLVANDGGANYAPGNFGYLDTNAGNGAQATAQTLGRVDVPGDCVEVDGVTTKPGEQVSVLDALNTRFDIYANGLNNACGTGKGLCPPSANTRKDLMLKGNGSSCTNGCAFATGAANGWHVAPSPYLPTSTTTPLTAAQYSGLSPMGYPRDMCHAVSVTGSCSGGRIGDGNWDRAAYFGTNTANYSSVPTSGEMITMFGTDTPTRYQVYKYEAANAATRLQSQAQGGLTAYSQPVPTASAGVAVGGASPDRRVLSIAVINCTAEGVQGRATGVEVKRWVDVFLVEPSVPRSRTENSDVYVEVIGETSLGGGGSTASQTIRRDVPYLVR